ncbi:tRNA methyltransferase [Infundibulicybe gibba]|nr:tRNA methyltransferase [Infundibulicybe gibba]
MSATSSIDVPDGFTLHTENTSHILRAANEAFLNPVQEFNRDTSVACIRVWSEELNKNKEARWSQTRERRAKKNQKRLKGMTYKSHNFVLLEALSATGLRSIRYAKEIPLVKYVIANDLSTAAIAAMRRNIEINGFGESSPASGKIRINEGDACTLMYSHREERNRVDVVDLDPYGTAAPFIDAAVQCINDEGLLCVTCTDLSVLATTNYPEKCFSNYGGVPVKAEYCHEAACALRLVLHSISTSASRYGRYIEPLLSLSIDFYVRLFIRIKTSPIEVKKALTKTAAYYICSTCQSFYEQPLGRIQAGPSAPERCSECDSVLHLAGPMWSGHIHDTPFVTKVLEHLEANQDQYGTSTRMKGMLTVAKEELHTPFYFTPAKVASFFHTTTPPLDDMASALLHAGHKISRSHACPGSLKTTATRADIYDTFRSWAKLHPVKMENLSESSPARKLLARELRSPANFKRHPDSVTPSGKVKLVRYQENPTSHWGPGTKAVSGGAGTKRKRDKVTNDP